MKLIKYVIIIFILLLILSIPTIIFWEYVKEYFFNYSLLDLFSVFCIFFIGIVVTVYFSQAFSKSNKRRDIIIENLEDFNNYYKEITKIISYFNKKKLTDETKNYLIKLFKFASCELPYLLENIISENIDKKIVNSLFNKVKDEHFKFKEIITDSYFSKNRIINEDDFNTSMKHYNEIKQNIQKIKLIIYK